VARLELERDAARRRDAYLVLDASAQQIALACRGVVMWRQPVRCDAARLLHARSGQKLLSSPGWRDTTLGADSVRVRKGAKRVAAMPAPATPITTLAFEELRLRLVTPRPPPPAPTNVDLVREWLQLSRGPSDSETTASPDVEVEITSAAANTLCEALAPGTVLLLQPLASPAVPTKTAKSPAPRVPPR
jgi:hypothetical protein